MLEDLLRQASLTVHTAANLLRRLSTNPWLNSVEITAVIPVGATSVTVLHGLGRTLNGAAVIGASSVSPSVVAQLPGDDAQTHVTILASAAVAVSDLTVKLRAY